MFGKFENDMFIQAPSKIQIEDNIIYNPTEDILLENGYLPVEEEELYDHAPEGYEYIPTYVPANNKIILRWELTEIPGDISPEEAISIITGGYV